MSDGCADSYDRNGTEAQFRRVMSYVTDRAWAEGLEEDVMPALFDVLEKAARRRDVLRRRTRVKPA